MSRQMPLFDSFGKLFSGLEDDGKAMLENQADKLRLRTVKALSVVLSAIVTYIFLALVLFAAMLFITLALSQLLGELLENAALAYLIVGGVFLIIFIAMLLFKSKLFINRFVSMFIKLFYSEQYEK